ncbi:hypothetical protein D3C76_1840910 [compost metagenome]
MASVIQRFAYLPYGIGDIADHLDLGKIHSIDFRGTEVDMDDFGAPAHHEEWWLLNHVVTDIDDQVCSFDRAMHEVT